MLSGSRRVKGYPVTRDELFGIGGAGLLATTCFSIGGGLVGRSFDIQKDLDFNKEVPVEIRVRWQTKETDYLWFGSVLILIGVVAIVAGGAKVLSIINSTKHNDDQG